MPDMLNDRKNNRILPWLAVAAIIMVVDQASKLLVLPKMTKTLLA